eukprot:Pompholyxophrys_punicea_v1_NODE_603_length_1607_cov_5.250000.p2 type:complete len:100 gc:universal NODE_603_length_1607_cov_5.250000:1075-776(-)
MRACVRACMLRIRELSSKHPFEKLLRRKINILENTLITSHLNFCEDEIHKFILIFHKIVILTSSLDRIPFARFVGQCASPSGLTDSNQNYRIYYSCGEN